MRESGKFLLVKSGITTGSWNLEYSCRNPESGIQDPLSKDGESSNGAESKIEDCLGFPYMGREKSTKQKVNLCLFAFASNFFKQNVVFLPHFTTHNRRKVHGHRCLQNTVKRPRYFNRLWKAVRTTWKLLDTTLARTLIITSDGFSCELKIS